MVFKAYEKSENDLKKFKWPYSYKYNRRRVSILLGIRNKVTAKVTPEKWMNEHEQSWHSWQKTQL